MPFPRDRGPSPAELAGWRRFWDGWVICPPCMARPGFIGGPYTPETWVVPMLYDRAIQSTDKCSRCDRFAAVPTTPEMTAMVEALAQ